MKVKYTKNNNCYVLTNFADSNNPIFQSEIEVENFKLRINEKLKELVEIISFDFSNDQYQMLVSLNSRNSFVSYYRSKHSDIEIEEAEIPESTYILSQEMANIQSGYAKWFNHMHKRFGSVFGRRYTKILIQTEEELKDWVRRINDHILFWTFEDFWSYTKNFLKKNLKLLRLKISSGILYKENLKGGDQQLSCFINIDDYFLRGRYLCTHFIS
jgi:hypothetical protein